MSDGDAVDEQDEGASEPADPFEELCSTLNIGERLSLSRSAPAPEVARGHLCTMDMPASRSGSDLMDIVQKRWGGGTFIVRRQAKLGQKSRWLKGAAVFQLAGPPLMDGRPIDPRTGEIIETPRAEVVHNPMMFHQPPAPQAQPDPNVIGALTQALIASRDGGQPLGVAELVALAQQLTPQPQPQQPRTPLAEIKQYVGFLGELKDLIGGGSRDESPSESMGIPKTMEEAFVGFMKQGGIGAMFGQGGAPQPQPPTLPTQGPPGALWDPARQTWVPGPSASAPPRPAPPQTPTPNPGQPPPPAAAVEAVDDEWEEEPITPELVVETLQAMGAAEAREFVARVQSALGPAVVDKFAKSLNDD